MPESLEVTLFAVALRQQKLDYFKALDYKLCQDSRAARYGRNPSPRRGTHQPFVGSTLRNEIDVAALGDCGDRPPRPTLFPKGVPERYYRHRGPNVPQSCWESITVPLRYTCPVPSRCPRTPEFRTAMANGFANGVLPEQVVKLVQEFAKLPSEVDDWKLVPLRIRMLNAEILDREDRRLQRKREALQGQLPDSAAQAAKIAAKITHPSPEEQSSRSVALINRHAVKMFASALEVHISAIGCGSTFYVRFGRKRYEKLGGLEKLHLLGTVRLDALQLCTNRADKEARAKCPPLWLDSEVDEGRRKTEEKSNRFQMALGGVVEDSNMMVFKWLDEVAVSC